MADDPKQGFDFRPGDYPRTPGVYLMKDALGRILYVGKAKDLRARLSSYFRKSADHTPKTRILLTRVAGVDILHAGSEKEALLLEASLIKKHRPRYNVVLRDDKQYVLFKLTRGHEYPRLTVTRKVSRDGSVHYGPFTSAGDARATFRLIGRFFPLRKCSDRTLANRSRPCLYHDIGQCMAPCVFEVDRERYREVVRKVEMILSGRTGELMRNLKKAMHQASEALEFERAAEFRDQARAVSKTVERQSAVLGKARDLDAVALSPGKGGEGLGLGVAFVRQGMLLDQKSFYWSGLSLEEAPEVLESFLSQFYTATRFIPPSILLPWTGEDEAVAELLSERRQGPVRLVEARTTEEKGLVAMARRTAAQAGPREGEPDLAGSLAARLGLRAAARRIESVDISHLGGEETKAGVVVFQDGEHLPDASRIYNIPEEEGGGDDYAALNHWIARRVRSGPPWPDLLLIDGGKGQLSAVEKGLGKSLPQAGEGLPGLELAAIAKGPSRRAGELEDRIFRPGRKNPLGLAPGSPELLYLQRIRDTAHRFVLGRQRRSRSKKLLRSELTGLPGIGPKTAALLWERFSSVSAMSEASLEDIRTVPGVGEKRAAAIHRALKSLG